MSTIVACFALLFCFGVGVVAGRCWQAGKPTPGERQETLARHVEPVQATDALAISAQDWQHAERILHEALGEEL